MGNSNPGNRSYVDRELGRVDDEYGGLTNHLRGPGGDFGFGRSNELRDQVIRNFSPRRGAPGSGGMMGGEELPYGPSVPGARNSGSSYGGDVNWTNSALGDTGSARGTYEDFSRTGGVDATALRRRATGMIPAFYDRYKDAARRRMNTQGGYSPGFDAQQAEIGREAARAGFQASRDVEGDIADKVMQGRLAGAGGLMNLGGMETQNNQFNTSGAFNAAEGNANRRQSASQFDRGFDEDIRRYDQDFGEGQRRFNAQGLASIYGQDNNDYWNRISSYLSGIGGRSGNAQSLIFGRTEPTSRISSILGGLGNFGTSLLGGFSGPRRRPQTSPYWEEEGGG